MLGHHNFVAKYEMILVKDAGCHQNNIAFMKSQEANRSGSCMLEDDISIHS
jgi:hypothetical protein